MASSSSCENQLEPVYTLDGIPIRNLFVSNLHYSVTSNLLREFFSRLGEIISVSVVRGRNPGKSSFGFVTFRDPVIAARALKLSGTKRLMNRNLYLNPADSCYQPIEKPDGTLAVRSSRSIESETTLFSSRNHQEIEEEVGEDVGEEEVDLNSDSPINTLIDDCLQIIFSYVDFKDHHILSRVCRRWRLLMFDFWDKVKELDLSSGPLSEANINDNSIKTYFSLCRNINSVVLDQRGHKITSQSIATTACSVPDLQELFLLNFSLVQRPLSIVAQRCRNLRRFAMKDCSYKLDNEMIPLFKNCRKLESFSLTNCPYHSGTWLSHLNPPLTSITIKHCSINMSTFCKYVGNLGECLKELVVIFSRVEVNFQLPELPRLEKLVLGSKYSLPWNPTLKIKGLKHLELIGFGISKGSWIKTLVEENPDLEALNISGGLTRLTPEEFEPLTQLTKLQHLNLSNVSCVDDSALIKLCKEEWKLVSLKLCHCTSVTEVACKRLITKLPNLTFLDLTGCSQISAITLRATVQARNADPGRQRLHLVIHGLQTLLPGSVNEGPIVWNAGCRYFTLHQIGQDDYFDDDFDEYDDDDDDYDYDDDMDPEYMFQDLEDRLGINNCFLDEIDELRLQAFLFDDMEDDAIAHFLD